ncbi:hypothetical protein LshimejAT787_0801050 [Lyophyllum shimeji]|uniref:Uncharacterized protein n=1 Tax=Lyophyllum shimeji TaxID=47721 RepID=A0A9P3PRG3_LYOSH|nr:hypothetical protein LshimejAT787_0801050 [Lyophyllum shimeji]
MAVAPMPTRRFFGDTGSLKSFRGDGCSSNPPSLKASSLKARKPFVPAMPSLLGRPRRWTQSGDSTDFEVRHRRGIKDEDFNAATPKPLPNLKPGEMHSASRMRGASAGFGNSDGSGQNKPEIAQRPSTRPKTILQLFSGKFRSRSSGPGQPSTAPTPFQSPARGESSFASKENREAALRERGLLPPLRPNADLSQAERERDHHLPVLPSPSNDEVLAVDGESKKVSAASIVKQEWEAKNKGSPDTDSQRERMSTFKFGGLALPPVSMEVTSTAPTISVSSPTISAEGPTAPSDTAASPLPPHADGSEAGSSNLTPSLDAASHTDAATTATLNTSESAPSTGQRSRPTGLKIQVQELKIPVIIESPVEEPSLSATVSSGLAGELAPAEVAVSIDTADTSALPNAATSPISRPRGRGFTEPPSIGGLKAPDSDRSKSFNPFKRSQALSPHLPSSDSPSGGATRRLSMLSMRRSFVGTLFKPEKVSDASRTPPSPTIPMDQASKSPLSPTPSPSSPKWTTLFPPGAAGAADANANAKGQLLSRRQAVSPTLHSRGSILLEASNIEDDETRRMTELAFLG